MRDEGRVNDCSLLDSRPSTLQIQTFGCRLNTYESEVMRNHAREAGLDNTIIFNTCAVTKEAERQARQSIRRARRENPDAKIIVTGCSAQIHPETYGAMDEVDVVLGNEEKLQVASYKLQSTGNLQPATNSGEARIQVNDIMSVEETASHLVSSFDGHTRAFIQVQNGCNHRCTFCIIPFGRGNSRSVPIGEVVAQVRHLVELGTKEVVLTGVDISSYGEGLPGEPTLGQLCKRLLAAVPELARLRISSIDAVEVDDGLFRLIAEEPRLMPHLHISLQAGDDMVLKRMKRRHLRQDAIDFCARVRDVRPDVVFGADIIAGFPTESDEMFQNTVDLVTEAGLTYLHIFPYSEREGTPAMKMPAVPMEIRKQRAATLRELGKQQEAALYKQCVGKQVQVLMESDGIGRSEQFVPVKCADMQAGELASVMLNDYNGNHVIASFSEAIQPH